MTEYSLENPDKRLEINASEFNSLIEQAMGLLTRHISEMQAQNTVDMREIDKFKQFFSREKMPEKGEQLAHLLDENFLAAMNRGYRSYSGGYMADIPGGGLLHSAVGDLLTSVFNRWPGLFLWAPGVVEIEKTTIEWMCSMMGLPEGAGGIYTSGGSMANMNAIFVARTLRFADSFADGVIYVSDQAHHSITKAAFMTGIAKNRIRIMKSGPDGAIVASELETQIKQDISQNLVPFLVVANAGTTRVGSCDDLEKLHAIAHEHSCWFHVDAAWAGSLCLTGRGKKVMRGIERADSITIDPHKAFWTPWGSGAFLVRDPEKLHRAFSVDADYLPFQEADDLMLNPSNISAELSRNARGLQLWLPIKLCGTEVFRNYLEEKLDLAELAEKQLKRITNIEITHRPVLGIVAFRMVLPGMTKEQLNDLNKKLLDKINEDCRIFISSTIIDDRFLIRIAPLNFRTHKQHVETALSQIEKAVSSLC